MRSKNWKIFLFQTRHAKTKRKHVKDHYVPNRAYIWQNFKMVHLTELKTAKISQFKKDLIIRVKHVQKNFNFKNGRFNWFKRDRI